MLLPLLIWGIAVALCELRIARDTHLKCDCICTKDIRFVWMNEDTLWFRFRAESIVLRVWSVFRAEERFVYLIRTAN
jgi:hypothetical protein